MKKTINENQLRAIVAESVKKVLKEIDDPDYQGWADTTYYERNKSKHQEEIVNRAIDALMGVREIVSRASDCWEYEDVNAPLFQQICRASAAIEAIKGFSRYGDDIRAQKEIEQHEQD